jgi:hypothetical protein
VGGGSCHTPVDDGNINNDWHHHPTTNKQPRHGIDWIKEVSLIVQCGG